MPSRLTRLFYCLTLLGFLTSCVAQPAATPTPTAIAVPDGWELLWHDEFDGASIDAAIPADLTARLTQRYAYHTVKEKLVQQRFALVEEEVKQDKTIHLVLRRTVFGRRAFALGSSEAAARACGIAIDRLKLAIYGVAGLFTGLAGVMQMSRLRQGDPTVAAGTELDVIAAVVIGGGSLSGGEGSILGSMVGALVMAFLRNGSQQMGWPTYVQEILIGVIIVVAVAVDRWRHAQGDGE